MQKTPISEALWFKMVVGIFFLILLVGGFWWYFITNPTEEVVKIFPPKASEIGSDFVELSGYYRLPEGKWGIPGFCIWEKGFENEDPEYVWLDNGGSSSAIQSKPGYFKARKELSDSCYSTEFIARAFVLHEGKFQFSLNDVVFRTKPPK